MLGESEGNHAKIEIWCTWTSSDYLLWGSFKNSFFVSYGIEGSILQSGCITVIILLGNIINARLRKHWKKCSLKRQAYLDQVFLIEGTKIDLQRNFTVRDRNSTGHQLLKGLVSLYTGLIMIKWINEIKIKFSYSVHWMMFCPTSEQLGPGGIFFSVIDCPQWGWRHEKFL